MSQAELETYTGWIRKGRHVLAGEKANFYLVNDDGTEGVAVFAFDQTAELIEPHETEGWNTIRPAAEKPQKKSRKQASAGPVKPKIKIDYNADTQQVRVWVGPNKHAIKQLRKNGFRFNPRNHRWTAQRDDFDKVIAGITAHNKDAEIEVVIDG